MRSPRRVNPDEDAKAPAAARPERNANDALKKATMVTIIIFLVLFLNPITEGSCEA